MFHLFINTLERWNYSFPDFGIPIHRCVGGLNFNPTNQIQEVSWSLWKDSTAYWWWARAAKSKKRWFL